MVQHCSMCGEEGHNVATCAWNPSPPRPPPPPQEIEMMPIRLCSHCRRENHTIRTCPELNASRAQAPAAQQPRQPHCAHCQSHTHITSRCRSQQTLREQAMEQADVTPLPVLTEDAMIQLVTDTRNFVRQASVTCAVCARWCPVEDTVCMAVDDLRRDVLRL